MKLAGYVAALAVDWVIYGFGEDEQEARHDCELSLKAYNIQLVEEETAMPPLPEGPTYVRRRDIIVLPATEALLQAVKDGGGTVVWKQCLVACLPRELAS